MGALWVTGVPLIIAMPACGAGAVPQFAETEWCYYNGGYACLNAWGGGPYVNVYTGGPETSDTHQDFAVFANPGTGYAEIGFTGSGSWSGECIGDASNNSGLADVSLDSCGSSSGGQGWGTNFTWGTDGCPSGEAWFKNVHWNGYLGPPRDGRRASGPGRCGVVESWETRKTHVVLLITQRRRVAPWLRPRRARRAISGPLARVTRGQPRLELTLRVTRSGL